MKLQKQKKLVLESSFNSPPSFLYNFLSTPSGLSSWFCDDVSIKQSSLYCFFWGKSGYEARIVGSKKDHFIRFSWLNEDKNVEENYFEFKIEQDSVTNNTFLIITSISHSGEHEIEEEDWVLMTKKLKQYIGG